jgi:high-affinity iron transporter
MKYNFMFLILLQCLCTFSIADDSNPGSPELVVHLLDYLAKDYGGAVQNGKVISNSEYDEQKEFGQIVKKTSSQISAFKNERLFIDQIKRLTLLIDDKGAAEDVARLARRLQQEAIRLADIQVAPKIWPDITLGAKIYQQNCIACHGNQGHGDGLAGASLDPKPANFHDSDLVLNSAPYKFYNTIRFGVPGTGMTAFPHLSDNEVWALAFYLKSLPYAEKAEGGLPNNLELKDVATLTDFEILKKLGVSEDKSHAMLGSIRTKKSESSKVDPFHVAEQLLDESVEAASTGDFSKASTYALRAYLEGIEPLEPKIKANLPGYVEQIERLMSGYRSNLEKQASIADIRLSKISVVQKINEIRNLISSKKMSPGVAFGAAFSIFLREGFEAVLIIVVLLSILRAMNQPQAIRWIHVGWVSAVFLGFVAWLGSGILLSMSGLSRELLEGLISILAVAVLIYVGFWLHRYAEMKKWRIFLESKLREGMTTKSYLGLALVAFFAVFREAFEVVLFLRAVWIDLDSSGQVIAGGGVFASLVILLVISWFAVRESRKLPIGLLFQVCSWTMVLLALILAGKGVHSLQEAGIVSVSTLPIHTRFDLIGVYPSYQTILSQVTVAILFLILFMTEKGRATVNIR